MMKKFKRIASFLLAMVMILAMSFTVFAADMSSDLAEEEQTTETTIGFPDAPTRKPADISNHKFMAYQIFAGEQTGTGEDADLLVNITWGSGIGVEDGNEFLVKLQKGLPGKFDNIAADDKAANAVAMIVKDFTDAEAKAFAKIVDEWISSGHGEGTELPEDAKTSLPAGYYLIVDEGDDEAEEDDAKNLSILQLTRKHDFTPTNKTDVPELNKKVKEINDSDSTMKWDDVADYDIGDDVEFVLTGTLPENYADYETYKYVFHDKLSDGLSLNDDSIKVYVGKGNEVSAYTEVSANVYSTTPVEGDSLTVTFENLKESGLAVDKDSVIRVVYTAKLTGDSVVFGGEGNKNTAHLEYSNNPNHHGDGEEPTGKTPKDTVFVFTYKLITNKVGEDGETPLLGAGFTLSKKIVGTDGSVTYEQVGDELTGEALTTFVFKGIDAGDYKLEETTVPAGYNKAEILYFTVTAEYNKTTTPPTITKLEIGKVCDENGKEFVDSNEEAIFEFSASIPEGSLSADIVNQKGIILPSTGGIGTTIFYIVGGILVVGAGILLVTKKRMKSR